MGQLKKSLSPELFLQDENDMSLEQMVELCEEASQADSSMTEYYENMAAEIKSLVRGSEELEGILQKMDLPATLLNLAGVKEMMGGQSKTTYRLWNEEESKKVMESFDEPEELLQTFEEIDENHRQTIEEQKESDDITYSQAVTLAQMSKHISFFAKGRQSQMYDVPVYTEQGIVSCRVTIQSREAQKGNVEISLESESLGKVVASFRVRGKSVNGFVTAEHDESMAKSQRMLHTFKKDLEELGFTMEGESLIRGSRTSLQVGDSAEGAKNRDLYLVAKCFIANIAGKDETAYED